VAMIEEILPSKPTYCRSLHTELRSSSTFESPITMYLSVDAAVGSDLDHSIWGTKKSRENEKNHVDRPEHKWRLFGLESPAEIGRSCIRCRSSADLVEPRWGAVCSAPGSIPKATAVAAWPSLPWDLGHQSQSEVVPSWSYLDPILQN